MNLPWAFDTVASTLKIEVDRAGSAGSAKCSSVAYLAPLCPHPFPRHPLHPLHFDELQDSEAAAFATGAMSVHD